MEATLSVIEDPTSDYSPAQLRSYLRRYHEIAARCDGAHAIRYDSDRIAHTVAPDPMRNVHLKRDIDSALGWLQTMDSRSAVVVFEHYVGIKGNKPVDTADLADHYGMSQRQVHRMISTSIDEMAWFLGWRSVSD